MKTINLIIAFDIQDNQGNSLSIGNNTIVLPIPEQEIDRIKCTQLRQALASYIRRFQTNPLTNQLLDPQTKEIPEEGEEYITYCKALEPLPKLLACRTQMKVPYNTLEHDIL